MFKNKEAELEKKKGIAFLKGASVLLSLASLALAVGIGILDEDR